ncbi:hypothetical protein PHYC_00416 [Phycisphaerales bacterium]|nr:hypothetical protein PHYC_00416 [Phycisphaerales bacterium]
MLILFDIDLTLITTGGCGVRAMTDAGREVFGPAFSSEGVSYAGRLDPLIIGEMFALSNVADTPANRAALRDAYRRILERYLVESQVKRALPGVIELLARIRARRERDEHLVLGLLTGNFEETGSMKLRACGIEPEWFEVAAWGDHSDSNPPRREHLVPVAMNRYAGLRGRPVRASRVVVVGDTPHDVGCAKAHGCRSVAVATGRTPAAELSAAGADLVLADLSDAGGFERWLDNVVD